MKQCPMCEVESPTLRGVKQHYRRIHEGNANIPDLIRLGVMKRKLTRKEAKEITKEVMEMNIFDEELRFIIAVMKAITKVIE